MVLIVAIHDGVVLPVGSGARSTWSMVAGAGGPVAGWRGICAI